MSSKTSDELWWISFIVLAVWTVNGILMFFLLSRIDSIVNVQLYNYGLQFSKEWADSYWTSSQLMMIIIVLPMALSVIVFSIAFYKYRKKASGIFSKKKKEPPQIPTEEITEEIQSTEEAEPAKETEITEEIEQCIPVVTECTPEAQPEPEEGIQLEVIQPIQQEIIEDSQNNVIPVSQETEVDEEPKVIEGVGLVVSCPSCGKVFNRPMVMLDFSNGTTRLVNICPFCNHILGEALNSKKNAQNEQG